MWIVRSICCVEFEITCVDSVTDELLDLLREVLGDAKVETLSLWFWNVRKASLKVGPSSNSAPPSLAVDWLSEVSPAVGPPFVWLRDLPVPITWAPW